MIAHPEKTVKGGEDAFFANRKYYLKLSRLLVVADGVGG